MAVDYGKYKNERYCYLPKIGETKIFKFLKVSEVTGGQDRFHFTQNEKREVVGGGEAIVKVSLGYHIEAEIDEQVELADGKVVNKILSITSLGAFISVFKAYELNDGDRVKIFHKDRGEWEVIRLDETNQPILKTPKVVEDGKDGEEVPWDEETLG